ncbi:MAG: hypothetical protein ACKVHO_11120, partial [Verrucomicrobiia bacterium]
QLAGIAADDPKLDGRDLSPILFRGIEWPQRTFFWELGAHAELARRPWSALRTGDWKYLNTPSDGEFLFNLADDPNEQKNLAAAEPARLSSLRNQADHNSRELRQ